MVEDINSGRAKHCPKCGRVRPIDQFQRRGLKTGQGRTCNSCAA
jgi:hypothetical protein